MKMAGGHYVLSLADVDAEVAFTGDAAQAMIPPDAEAAFSIGAEIRLLNATSAPLEVKLAAGVGVVSPDGVLEIQPAEAAAQLTKIGPNCWEFKRA